MGGTAPLPRFSEVSPAARENLSRQKVYFGHQSVGDNLLGGLANLMKQEPGFRLDIVKSSDPSRFDRPVFAHSYVGANGDPDSKTRAFEAVVRAGIGGKADIALFKFCFWDIRATTDVGAVFKLYKETLAALEKDYPTTVFVHVTVPLTIHRSGLRQRLKSLVGRPDSWDLDNVKRSELNALMVGEYRGKEPIFDIARAQSTLPDGRRTTFTHRGNTYPALAPSYGSDGAHLNEEGARWVAEQFLVTLARIAEGHRGG